MFSAARIQALRKSKGYSQELLAEQSGVSLRTIQRVEQGETVPRGHTVQALATALGVPLAALLAAPVPEAAEAPEPPPLKMELELRPAPAPVAEAVALAASELPSFQMQPEPAPLRPLAAAPAPPAGPALRPDPQVLELLNLSALCLLIFPFLNLLVPYLLWRRHRHDTAHAAEVGRRVLGFQVLWQVASFGSYLVALLLQAGLAFYFGVVPKGLFLGVFVLTYLVNVATVGSNQLRLRRGRLDIYPIRL